MIWAKDTKNMLRPEYGKSSLAKGHKLDCQAVAGRRVAAGSGQRWPAAAGGGQPAAGAGGWAATGWRPVGGRAAAGRRPGRGRGQKHMLGTKQQIICRGRATSANT